MTTVAFQGVLGSFSSIAGRELFPSAKLIPYKSFFDVILSVETSNADFGIIPLENSYAGRVAEIHNILPKTKLFIASEHSVFVKHNLCGLAGSKIASIKKVISHP